MNAATIFKTLTTVTLSITLLITGGCNNMEAKKKKQERTRYRKYLCPKERPDLYTPTDRKRKSGFISKSCHGCTDSSKQAALGFRGSG